MILVQLRNQEAPSVSALARSLESSRPSDSRSLYSLREKGLAECHGRAWRLTEQGAAEVEETVGKLKESTVGLIGIAGRQYQALDRIGLAGELNAPFTEPFRSQFEPAGGVGDMLQGIAASGIQSVIDQTAPVSASAIDSLGMIGNATRVMDDLVRPVMPDLAAEGAALMKTYLEPDYEKWLGAPSLAAWSGIDHEDMLGIQGIGQSILSHGIAAVIADEQLWPSHLAASLSGLDHWSDPDESVSAALQEISPASIFESVRDLVEVGLPEPLLSDALRVYDIDTPLVHTPTYRYPSVELMETVDDVERRARDAKRHRMVSAYDTLAEVEQGLRQLIATLLGRHHGPTWWTRSVDPGVRNRCTKFRERRKAQGSLAHSDIDYAYTGDLHDIMIQVNNWNQVFSPVFRERDVLDAMFVWLGPVRNDIAHVRESSDEDYNQFMIAANWILKRVDEALEG